LFWKHARAALAALPLWGSGGAMAEPSAAVAVAELQPALLTVSVNGEGASDPVMVLRRADGAVYLPVEAARAWRLGVDGLPTMEADGILYVAITGVPGLTARVSDADQSLSIHADPSRLGPSVLAGAGRDQRPMTPAGWGGFVNYELLAEHGGGPSRLSGSLEFVAFSPMGFGTTSVLGRWSGRDRALIRLESNWTIDDPARMRSLRLGDSISRGGIGGGPLRFGGVQVARNFAVEPGFVTFPMLSFSGSAALPSVVDVYVNEVLQGGRDVRPGPFRILDVPIVTGSGEVQLVVRDLLGRETIMRQSYYVAPGLLRPGLHDYSYEAGFLRRNFGRRSADYGAMFASATHRFGFSAFLTGEVHAEGTGDLQQAGAAASWLWPELGLFSGGVAASTSERGTGALVSMGFERRSRRLSIGVSAEFTTRNYATLGTRDDRPRPAATVQAFAGMPVSFGSVGASYIWRDQRGAPDVQIVSANVSVRLPGIGSLHVAARQSIGNRGETAVEAFVTVPVGGRSHAGAGLSYRDGAASATLEVQRNAPAGEGVGYRLAASLGRDDRVEGRLDVETAFGGYQAMLTWTERGSGVRIVANGAIGMIGGRVFASRPLTESFAAVKVGGFPNVRVYADNRLVARTNADGVAILPRLRPFETNRVRIAVEDLPMDAEFDGPEISVRPPGRSGVAVDFAATQSRSAIVNIVLADGRPLPAGTLLRVDGAERDFVSAPGGDAYLAGLGPVNMVTALAEGGACRFALRVPAGDEVQPDLGRVICRSAP